MKTIVKSRKINQLIYIEYENAKPNGHFLTVTDSFRNVLSRGHKKFNEKNSQMEYVFYDPQGNELLKGDNLLQLKNDFAAQKEIHFQKAYENRLEKLQQLRQSQGKEIVKERKSTGRRMEEMEKKNSEKERQEKLQQLREVRTQEQSREFER